MSKLISNGSLLLAWPVFSLIALGAFAPQIHGHDDPNDPSHHHSSEVSTTRSSAIVLPSPPQGDDVFHFVIYGDRTGGVPEGLKVLEQAVVDTNLLDPDLVMTVGDLIQGYNETPEWLEQMKEFKQIANRLEMKWYPVAGNHDVYWRGENQPPRGQHESNYEKHFGPLWYHFRHKNAGFIVLYSDEGDPETNLKAFNVGKLQNMSEEQLAFLDGALEELSDTEHVFVFLHHPRWIGGGYTGSNWPVVHERLVKAGNVSAVFAGHIHHMRFDGPKDGIDYYALATTGGHLSADIPDAGYLHHLNMVTVREGRISVSAIPIGAVIDPKKFTEDFLASVDQARKIRPIQESPELIIDGDGACRGDVTVSLKNSGPLDVDVTLSPDESTMRSGWTTTLDHQHFRLAADSARTVSFQIRRSASPDELMEIPALKMEIDALSSSSRVRLPDVISPLTITPGQVPADYFSAASDRCLVVNSDDDAIRIESKELSLPDGPMTLEGWFRPSELAGYRGMLAKTESSEFGLFSDEGAPEFSILLDGHYVNVATTTPMKVDQWTHVAAVYDGSEVRLFVNGEKVDSKSVKANSKQKRNSLPFFVGADPNPRGEPTRGFRGMIDEVRISKTAVYTDSFTPPVRHEPDSETVLLLHLDRSLGPFVLDHSSQASKGLLGRSSRLVESPSKR